MEKISQFRVVFSMEDSHGWKWGKGIELWTDSLESALNGGKLFMEWQNNHPNGEKVTGYYAYEMGKVRS